MIRFARWVPGLSVAERGDKVAPGLVAPQFQLYGVFWDAVSDRNDTSAHSVMASSLYSS